MREELKHSAIAGIIYGIVLPMAFLYGILPGLSPYVSWADIGTLIGMIWQYWLLYIIMNAIAFPGFYILAEWISKKM